MASHISETGRHRQRRNCRGPSTRKPGDKRMNPSDLPEARHGLAPLLPLSLASLATAMFGMVGEGDDCNFLFSC